MKEVCKWLQRSERPSEAHENPKSKTVDSPDVHESDSSDTHSSLLDRPSSLTLRPSLKKAAPVSQTNTLAIAEKSVKSVEFIDSDSEDDQSVMILETTLHEEVLDPESEDMSKNRKRKRAVTGTGMKASKTTRMDAKETVSGQKSSPAITSVGPSDQHLVKGMNTFFFRQPEAHWHVQKTLVLFHPPHIALQRYHNRRQVQTLQCHQLRVTMVMAICLFGTTR
jgi:hypothetical protein